MAVANAPVSVGIVVTPDTSGAMALGLFELFRSIGSPWQLGARFRHGQSSEQGRYFDPFLIAQSAGPIEVAHGVILQVGVGMADARNCEIICIPELVLLHHRALPGNQDAWRRWLIGRHAEGALLASCGSGVSMLADTGLLDGGRATTHWALAASFTKAYPSVTFETDESVMTAGHANSLMMAGSGTAWQDLGLHLVARFAGVDHAMAAARVELMQPHANSQRAWSDLTRAPEIDDPAISRAIVWLGDHFSEAAPVGIAVRQAGLAERTFTRRFHLATGVSPLEYVHRLRLGRARQMLESTSLNIQAIARELGYEDPSFFSRLFKREVTLTPAQYRKWFGALRRSLEHSASLGTRH